MKKLIAFVAVVAFLASAGSAQAFLNFGSDDITVTNKNSAYVKNDVDTNANTGSNTANGGSANSTVSSGGVSLSDDNNSTGNSNNDANAGDGGIIVTGNAGAASVVVNDVNRNKTRINACGCGDSDVDDVDVTNRNRAKVKNYVTTNANTGDNTANGSSAHSTVTSGGVHFADDGNKTGNSNNDSNAGWGGQIQTGNANSVSSVANVVNRNMTRIRR